MAFTFDTAEEKTGTSTSSLTDTTVTVSEDASALFVSVMQQNGTYRATTVTWDSVGADQDLPQISEGVEPSLIAAGWYGVNSPADGALAVSVSWANTVSRGVMVALPVSGGVTGATSEASADNDGTTDGGNTPNVDVDPLTANALILACCWHRDNLTPTARETEIKAGIVSADGYGTQRFESASTDSKNMDWTDSYSTTLWAAAGLAYEIAAAGGANIPAHQHAHRGRR